MSERTRELGNRRQAHQVSLRGASSKEITRDELLNRVSQERELRLNHRRQSAAALSIQRIWRGFNERRKLADQFEEESEEHVYAHDVLLTLKRISCELLRPLILFTSQARLKRIISSNNARRILFYFNILLQSISSNEMEKNFCSLALGSSEEKGLWHHQAKKLLCLSSFVLSECNTSQKEEDNIQLAASGMRLIISLTDTLEWKIVRSTTVNDAKKAVNKLIKFMITSECGLYKSVRIFIEKLDAHSLNSEGNSSAGGYFMVTVSAITLVLRPFSENTIEKYVISSSDAKFAVEQYCNYILSIPYLSQHLPPFLLSALRHPSSLLPCLQVPLIISDNSSVAEESNHHIIPAIGWLLANIIRLSTECSEDSGKFIPCLDLKTYVNFISHISETLMSQLESRKNLLEDSRGECSRMKIISSWTSFLELLKPLHQQWYLRNLLSYAKTSTSNQGSQCCGDPYFLDIFMFYHNMIRIYASLDPQSGPLPILNMLSFSPGYIIKLWEFLERHIFNRSAQSLDAEEVSRERNSTNEDQNMASKVSGNKWMSMLAKITRKSSNADGLRLRNDDIIPVHVFDEECEFWVVRSLKHGSRDISNKMQNVLFLFCSVYSHLLLVLDDMEFHDKQEPFTLSRQRRIASTLNTFVYGSFINDCPQKNKLLIDVSVRCLTLLHERDCRHQFCSPSLWVAPAWKNRLPIPAAALSHEALSSNPHLRKSSGSQGMSSVISTIPHVFPFEERVQMFREFIKLDREARRAAGELVGPGPGSMEIIIRRDHVIEDGFKQLNSLGSRL